MKACEHLLKIYGDGFCILLTKENHEQRVARHLRFHEPRSSSMHCAREGAVSAKEELLQGSSEHVVSRAMVLPFQGTQLRMRHRLAQRSRRLIHKGKARAT